MNAPRVSVVLPVHNGGALLDEAVGSVLAQSLPDLELLAVDDASSDDSAARLAAFARADPRLRVLAAPRNLGISGACNLALAEARGAFIARMDQDDRCLPRRLERQVAFLERNAGVGAVGGQLAHFGPGTRRFGLLPRRTRRHPLSPEAVEAFALFNCPLHGGAALWRSELGARYESAEDFSEDYGLWVRLLARGVRLANLAAPVLAYRHHRAQASAVHATPQAEVSRRLRRAGLERLGLAPDAADEAIHRRASDLDWAGADGELEALDAWLGRLRAAAHGRAWAPALDGELARIWTSALWAHRRRGRAARAAAAASPLSALPHPQPWKARLARAALRLGA